MTYHRVQGNAVPKFPIHIKAAILFGYNEPFEFKPGLIDEIRPDEILVQLAATGICHTDLGVRAGDSPIPPLPIILGHEGAGKAIAIGRDVTKISVGDSLVLTFSSCETCPACLSGYRARCQNFIQANMSGTRADGSLIHHCEMPSVHGSFFGQSSFATHAVVRQANAVKVRSDVPIELLGPLGCGVQTGAGTVLNHCQPAPGAAISIFGVGAVGLSAVMAAKIAGCREIVAIDTNRERLQLAVELGATRCIHADIGDLPNAMRSAAPGGFQYAIDTSGAPAAIAAAITTIEPGGIVALLAMPKSDAQVTVRLASLMAARIHTVVEGDSRPDTFIPELIEHYLAGNFPFDRLISFYDFEDINRAAEDLNKGLVIKPVLRMHERMSA